MQNATQYWVANICFHQGEEQKEGKKKLSQEGLFGIFFVWKGLRTIKEGYLSNTVMVENSLP